MKNEIKIKKMKLFSDTLKYVKTIKISDEPITRCNKNMKNMKQNQKVLDLSIQESNKEVFRD